MTKIRVETHWWSYHKANNSLEACFDDFFFAAPRIQNKANSKNMNVVEPDEIER